MAERFHLRPLDRSLARPVLIGGSFGSLWIVGPFTLAVVLMFVAIAGLARDASGAALVVGLVALVVAVPGFLAIAMTLHRRRWLQATPDGFVLTRNDSQSRFADDQIVGVSQRTRMNPDGSYWRDLALDITSTGGGDRVAGSYLVPAGQANPLFAFVERIILGMAKRISDGLGQGTRVEGQGWHFDQHGLHLHRGPRRGAYLSDELTLVGFYDNCLCVWRRDEDTPLVRIPDRTRNVHCLYQLLWQPMATRPGVNDPPPGSSLGRLLLVRRGGDAILGWCLLGLVLLLGALLGSAAAAPGGANLLGFGLLLAPLALLGGWLVWRASYMRLHFHQAGVAQPARGRAIRYDDLERMTWSPNLILLEAKPEAKRLPVRFATIGFSEDADLVGMRQHLARTIGYRWWEEVARGPVQWTTNLRFLPHGLEYRPAGVFSKQKPVLAPYHVTSYYLLGTGLELFVTGAAAAVLVQSPAEANFYPGLALLDWIYQSMREQAEQTKGQASEVFDLRKAWQNRKGATANDERVRSGDGPDRQVKSSEGE